MEVIQIVPPTPAEGWSPVVGKETLDLFDRLKLPESSRTVLCEEALTLLGRCVPPTAASGTQTGLAVGYVQSGKTMSFTALTALARDNEFALIIIIAGTTTALRDQSRKRLASDLGLDDGHLWSWLPVASEAMPKSATREILERTFADWRNGAPADERRTVLLTVMKNHAQLTKVTSALNSMNLNGIPTLIIDDEADQASLNTLVLKSDESSTYRNIKKLREALPLHTYVQYTATPQAPLLINIIDTLSPDFAEVLTPGPAYTGGKYFFKEHPELIREIPDAEISEAEPTDPPDTLLAALRFFFVGVAAGLIEKGKKGNRSMMIHPSQRRSGHSEYYRWVEQIRTQWRKILEEEPSDEDRKELLEAFEATYSDFQATVPDLPPFAEISKHLYAAVAKTMLEELNAARGQIPTIPWNTHYSWILVGGQAMDRGFTVEGLTVTYMPRGVGIGNADTVQQRARFFGYKRAYAGYCRVFLGRQTAEAFRRYVEHEEDIRVRLAHHAQSGAPLREWKRMFFLDSALKPTRDSVIDIGYDRASGDNEWYYMRQPYASTDGILANQDVVRAFLSSIDLKEDPCPQGRAVHQLHNWAPEVPLRSVLDGLLTRLHLAHAADLSSFTLLQLLLSQWLDREPDATCVVYEMSKGAIRERKVTKKDEGINPFQGASAPKGSERAKSGDMYAGDRLLGVSLGRPVVQIHKLRVMDRSDEVIADEVPVVAVYIPKAGIPDLLVQPQGSVS